MNDKMVDCPVCGKKVNFTKGRYRPFCSEKCQMIDLGHWLSGSYSLASQSPLSDEDLTQIEQHFERNIEGQDGEDN